MRLRRRERDSFGTGEVIIVGPSIFCGWAEKFEDHGEEFKFTLGLKEGLFEQEFSENAPDRPHVDGSGVGFSS